MTWTFQYKSAWDQLPGAAEDISKGIEKKNKRQAVSNMLDNLPKGYEDLRPTLEAMDPDEAAKSFANIYSDIRKQAMINSKKATLDPLTRATYLQTLNDPDVGIFVKNSIRQILLQDDLDKRGLKNTQTQDAEVPAEESAQPLMTPEKPQAADSGLNYTPNKYSPAPVKKSLFDTTDTRTHSQIETENAIKKIKAQGENSTNLENVRTSNQVNSIIPAQTKSRVSVKGAASGPSYKELFSQSESQQFMQELKKVRDAWTR